MVPVIVASVKLPTLYRNCTVPAALIEPGCAGSIRPVPRTGLVTFPVTIPLLPCVKSKVVAVSVFVADVTVQRPLMLPTVKLTVLEALSPLLSVTVMVAVLLPPGLLNTIGGGVAAFAVFPAAFQL